MRPKITVLFVLVVAVTGYCLWALNRPLPQLSPHLVAEAPLLSKTTALPWPSFGEAALGASGYGLLDRHGAQTPAPTASTAKLITALAVLTQKPLKPGEQGPMLTLGPQDVQYYDTYVAQQGSVVPVNDGEQISEYQVLQAMLLPSANNLAESLATWAFGSTQAYVTYANSFVKQLGMTHTHVADASGFSPLTTSTAEDLVWLGLAARNNPVLASIVAQSQATLPVVGQVQNVNVLLGHDGINGIKTGNTVQAGGVYLASGTYSISGHMVTIVTAIMDAPDLNQAMQATPPLLTAAQSGFGIEHSVAKGGIVGYYNTPWHTSVNAIADQPLSTFGWLAHPSLPMASLQPLAPDTPNGSTIGAIALTSGGTTQRSTVRLQTAIKPPTWQWRLLHP
ncbi:MAG TPA: hypothetical protein VFN56_04285 [Candidatus Saccharimonadales bacterium]|nr:hypothetical protein [Candidatus Saccharimonadales bacterium]